MKLIPAHTREQQINNLKNISFVRWFDGYQGKSSKAVCRCAVDGFEWVTTIDSIIIAGNGCPQCSGKRRWTEGERISQINARHNISFVNWVSGYTNSKSKAICKCAVDGFEWVATVSSLINVGNGCPQCGGHRQWTAEDRVAQINALQNISFVKWVGEYKGKRSKVICRCDIDESEWAASVDNLVYQHSGCPRCAKSGYDQTKKGTLYVLRSECGSMVKIGISNAYKRRHAELRCRTPFNWSCIELIHNDDGAFIANAEKELHALTERVEFNEPFQGYTEWRKWDDRLPAWLTRYQTASLSFAKEDK